MLRRHASEFRALLMLVDGALAILLLVGLSIGRFGANWLTVWQPAVQAPLAFAIAYATGWILVLWLAGLYRPRARWSLRAEAVALGKSTLLLGLITGTLLFVFRLPDVSRLFLLLLFPSQWLLALFTRASLRLLFESLRARGLNARYVLVVGAGARGQAFAQQLEAHRELGLKVRGFVDDNAQDLPNGWVSLGPIERLVDLLNTEVIDEVAICLPFDQWDHIGGIAQLCEEQGKIVRIPMAMLDRAVAKGRLEDLDGTPVYSLVNGPDRVAALVVKRAIDIGFSAVALVLLAPVLLAITVVLAANEGRPVLFSQVRVGLHGRTFRMVKFRTMVREAELRYDEVVGQADARGFKITNDPRITRVGRFLRRTSLDELPQLVHVLRGEMSLVGPRPAPPREVAEYDVWHRRRLSMKPGITGLWQVSARRSDDFDERAELDLSYIDRWSLWLDLRILMQTLPAAFEGR